MTHQTRLIGAALLAACAAFGGPAHATPFTLNFSGTVSQVQFDPIDPLGGAIGPGSSLYTYLNFDSSAVDGAPSPELGSYTLSGGTYGLAAVVDSILFPLMYSVNISVVNGTGGAPDQYSVFAWEGTAGGLGDYFSMSMLLQDDTGQAITSDALPLVAPDLNRFGIRTFTLAGQYTDFNGQFIQYEVLGTLTPVATVPEPVSLSLVGLSLLGCMAAGGTRTRRRASAAQAGAAV